ncbi:ANTAR domain-containing response regulator [Streptomyces sp. H27-D2]|uniref:ANTAR domain-containing response regulator n=1 Tax=Streptomyces sp. H27-D2 TaxID=3046304 RepID=UPI002DB6D722|nr:ANTAR domain-containing protein [Streptomyces sp. H27-D2]MEC4016970.1 ANTAR domain-containing protein [Streptomyces sp. H27-D2]
MPAIQAHTEFGRFPEEGSAVRSLAQLAEQAVRYNPQCCGASATARSEGGAEPPMAVTHPDLSPLVVVQWECGEGPIPAALDTGLPVGAEDLLMDHRWPEYRAEALEAGIRSSATLPYHHDGLTVTVTLYGFRPGVIGEKTRSVTALLGDLATTGLARERRYRAALAEVDQLDTALRTRPVVDQACGILMYVLECDADAAFDILRRMSQRTNRKLSDLAQALVRTRGRGIEAELTRLAPKERGVPGAAPR